MRCYDSYPMRRGTGHRLPWPPNPRPMRCYHNWSMSLYDIDPGGDCPEIVRMIVEIPKGSANKYEYDGTLGVFRLDRALYSAVHYRSEEHTSELQSLRHLV